MKIRLTYASYTLQQQLDGMGEYLELETAEEIFELAKRLDRRLIIHQNLEGTDGLITVYNDYIE